MLSSGMLQYQDYFSAGRNVLLGENLPLCVNIGRAHTRSRWSSKRHPRTVRSVKLCPVFPSTHRKRFVVISPPEVGGKQRIIAGHQLEILGQFSHWAEVLSVDITVRRSYGWHVGSIEHHRDHVVGEDVEKLLSHVVLRTQKEYNVFRNF